MSLSLLPVSDSAPCTQPGLPGSRVRTWIRSRESSVGGLDVAGASGPHPDSASLLTAGFGRASGWMGNHRGDIGEAESQVHPFQNKYLIQVVGVPANGT